MNDDLFNDEELVDESGTKFRLNNYWMIGGIAGIVILIIVLILASEYDKKRFDRRTPRDGVDPSDYKSKTRKKSPSIYKGKSKIEIPVPKAGDSEKPFQTQDGREVDINNLSRSVVLVIADGKSGSGTFLSKRGYFLTNSHVVSGTSNQDIYFSKNPRSPPKRYFKTMVVYDNSEMDIAVLQITSAVNNTVINELIPVKVGSSNSLKIGEEIRIYGYPGIGGNTITVTRGIISGFLEIYPPWIKTDAKVSSGNSGGGVFKKNGELIGIPTARIIDRKVESDISLIRPIDSIKKMIAPFL